MWNLSVSVPDHFLSFYFIDEALAAPLAEWLLPLICSALNSTQSHRCVFELSSCHMSDKPSSACGWSGGFPLGPPVFSPPND